MKLSNTLKSTAVATALLATLSPAAFAQVVIGFNELDNPINEINYGTAVLTYSDLATDPITFDAPSVGVPPNTPEQAIGIIDPDQGLDSFDQYTEPTGSFTVTITAGTNFNDTTFAFDSGANVIRGQRNSTSGLAVNGDRMRDGEVVIFTVDYDQDFIDSGFQLRLTGLNSLGTSSNRAANIHNDDFTIVGTGNQARLDTPVDLADGDSFYYVATSTSGRDQIGHLVLDIVVPEPSAFAGLFGLAGLLIARRRA